LYGERPSAASATQSGHGRDARAIVQKTIVAAISGKKSKRCAYACS
jgi:hypothetical protein